MPWICKECREEIHARISYDSINKDGSPSDYDIREFIYECWDCDGEWDAQTIDISTFADWED